MSSLHKQLILQGLKIPAEIICIIKDYTFMDVTMSKTKQHKHVALQLISDTQWSGKTRPRDEAAGLMVFWISADDRSPQFQLRFCTTCGNYITHTNYPIEGEYDKVACCCLLE
jgi:hypothetical protein